MLSEYCNILLALGLVKEVCGWGGGGGGGGCPRVKFVMNSMDSKNCSEWISLSADLDLNFFQNRV